MEILSHGNRIKVHVPIYLHTAVLEVENNTRAFLTDNHTASYRQETVDQMLQQAYDLMPLAEPVRSSRQERDADSDDNSKLFVSDIFVFYDDPNTVVFFDNDSQKIVKTAKLDYPVIGVFVPTSFYAAPQCLIACYSTSEALSFYVVKLSRSAKGEIIVRKYKQEVGAYAKSSDSQIEAISQQRLINEESADSYVLESFCVHGYDFWLKRFAYDCVLNDSAFGVRAVCLFKHNEKMSIISSASTRADFRNHKAVPSPGLLENYSNMALTVNSWTIAAYRNDVFLKKPNNGFPCAVIGHKKLFFLDTKLAKASKDIDPKSIMLFEMPGIVDVTYNDKKLLIAVNDNQIYGYENFDEFMAEKAKDPSVLTLNAKNPNATLQPMGYKGCVDDGVTFELPRPSYVINVGAVFNGEQRLYACDVFFSDAKETLVFCTFNSKSKAAPHNLYVMHGGKFVFKTSFKHKVASVKGVTAVLNFTVISEQNNRRKECKIDNALLLTVKLTNDSIIRFEVDMNAKVGGDEAKLVSSGPGRFLDF